jgi:hypothetical protein
LDRGGIVIAFTTPDLPPLVSFLVGSEMGWKQARKIKKQTPQKPDIHEGEEGKSKM